MSISVACQCGFQKDVPDDWLGMRIQCKCGRTFVVGEDGGIMEPPVVAPPVRKPVAGDGPIVPAEPTPLDESRVSPTGDAPWQIHSPDPHKTLANVRLRHHHAAQRRSLMLLSAALISLACLAALAIVLPQHMPWADEEAPHVAALPDHGTTEGTGDVKKGRADAESSSDSAGTDDDMAVAQEMSQADGSSSLDDPMSGDESGLSGATGELRSRVADLVQLAASDGLLLTGLFGDHSPELSLSAEQQTKIGEISVQLKAKDEVLASGELELDKWYAEAEKMGEELLAVLDDAQQRQLREQIERGRVERIELQDYAARLRPELEIPRISWRLEADGVRLPPIKDAALSIAAVTGCYLPQSATGCIAISLPAAAGNSACQLQIHNLATSLVLGTCEVQRVDHDQIVMSADGQTVAIRRPSEDGQEEIQVMSVKSGKLLASRVLPATESDPSHPYVLQDCIGNQVLCISGQGCWVWNFESAKTQAIPFEERSSETPPVAAMSPGGRYVIVAHPRVPESNGKPCHILELCAYELETGQLLGNQILSTDYREMKAGALAWSYDGKELALLWDVPAPDPKRMLLHLSAINGDLLRTVDGLPPAAEGYAGQHGLQQRDLMWLPDKTGWITNLQTLVESESGALIDIELPKLQQAPEPGQPDGETIVEVVPAGEGRLLLVIARRLAEQPSVVELTSRFLDLPKMGPFM